MNTKRTLIPAVVLIAALAAIAFWKCGSSGPETGTSSPSTKVVAKEAAPGAFKGEAPDPRSVKRTSIEGTITDEDKALVPGARVCADVYSTKLPGELTRDPRCTTADAKGHYTLTDLFAARYLVVASAKPYQPGSHRPKPDARDRWFTLAAGEHKSGVDIVLRKGGVEITGTVSDVNGGAVAKASVRAGEEWWSDDTSPPVETDDAGKFSMWVKPGAIQVTASSEGYADGSDSGNAPGTFEILLTPESSLAGIVVDVKTGAPVPGATVSVSSNEWGFYGGGDQDDITDDQGKFRVTRLDPGRYNATARSSHGYGMAEGSTLVGLGQHVDGVVVKLHPGYRVSGVVKQPDGKPCAEGDFSLRDTKKDRWVSAQREPDGSLHADGVLPGVYNVDVSCPDYLSRDKYATVEVKDKDLDGLEWEVDAGATLTGRVLDGSSKPIEGVDVWARTTGGAARSKTAWGGDESKKDGMYKMTGLKPGTFRIEVRTDAGMAPKDGWKVEVPAGKVTTFDLVLETGGSISGSVVDAQGKPVSHVNVRAESVGGNDWRWDGGVRTNDDGTFKLDNLRAGDYQVQAHRGWWSDLRKPGTTDDAKQGERVTVATSKTSTVKLVVETQSGKISGTVVDSAGQPISDAFIVTARESDAAGAFGGGEVMSTRWSADEKPVLSSVDGKFTVTRLSPGKYTLRAFRKGGGEAVAEHVPVGGTAKLQIKATGSIAGTAKRDGKQIDEVSVELRDAKTGFRRNETFFRTSGVFKLPDLPAGNFTLTATSDSGKKQITVELAEGQHKVNVDVELDELVNIAGRVVDLQTKQPVAGMRLFAGIGKQGGGFSFSSGNGDEMPNVSDTDGRFTIEDAPKGSVTIRGMPKDFQDSEYGWITVVREITKSGTVDIGDITVIKKRVKDGDPVGELGVRWAEAAPGTDIDKHEMKVSWIDPKGAAAKSELQVGDVVISVDGVNVSGADRSNAWMLMRAPPGTAIKLGTKRGLIVTVVLAAP